MALNLEKERSIAEIAVLRACILTKRMLNHVQGISKEDASPVTVADFAAQALLISTVRHAFPTYGFVGEEDASEMRKDSDLAQRVFDLVKSVKAPGLEPGSVVPGPASISEMLDMIDLGGKGEGGNKGRFWVMDPIDGTKMFLEGGQYAVSLALIEDGKEVLGVLGCPNLKLDAAGHVRETSVDKDGLGIMLSAVKGQGVTTRTLSKADDLPLSKPMARLTAPANMKDLHVVDCVESKASRHDIVKTLMEEFGGRYPGTEVWSSHMRYAALIVGGGDFQLRVPSAKGATPCIWDHAGAQLIFTELGGKVTDLDGKDIDFSAGRKLVQNRGMVIAKTGIHGEILAKIRALLEDEKANKP